MTADVAGRTLLPVQSNRTKDELVQRLFDEVLNPRRLERLSDFASPDMVNHSTHTHTLAGLAGWQRELKRLFAAFPDARFTVQDIVSAEERVAARVMLSAGDINQPQVHWFRIIGERIVEHWGGDDTPNIQEQP